MDEICQQGYSATVRNVSEETKQQVYREYGIYQHKTGEYEVDHIIPLEIGGSNDISNLFPEAASPKPGFHEKDQVENYLRVQVCGHKMDLKQAQAALADSTFHVALFPEQRSGFASFGYRLGDWVPYGVVARKVSRRAATPDLGRLPLLPGSAPLVEAVDQAIHLDEYDQTTVSAGLRWDFNDQADLKFQLDRVQMHNATGNWLVDQPGWNGKALVMSVTLDFILGGVH